jgi:hypothetical protein
MLVINKSAQIGNITIRVAPAKLPDGETIRPWGSL